VEFLGTELLVPIITIGIVEEYYQTDATEEYNQ